MPELLIQSGDKIVADAQRRLEVVTAEEAGKHVKGRGQGVVARWRADVGVTASGPGVEEARLAVSLYGWWMRIRDSSSSKCERACAICAA